MESSARVFGSQRKASNEKEDLLHHSTENAKVREDAGSDHLIKMEGRSGLQGGCNKYNMLTCVNKYENIIVRDRKSIFQRIDFAKKR